MRSHRTPVSLAEDLQLILARCGLPLDEAILADDITMDNFGTVAGASPLENGFLLCSPTGTKRCVKHPNFGPLAHFQRYRIGRSGNLEFCRQAEGRTVQL